MLYVINRDGTVEVVRKKQGDKLYVVKEGIPQGYYARNATDRMIVNSYYQLPNFSSRNNINGI